MALVIALIFGLGLDATTASTRSPVVWRHLRAGPHEVGYQAIDVRDPSRGFGPRVAYGAPEGEGGARARPLRISIWYPARAVEGTVRMRYQRYIEHTAAEMDPERRDERVVRQTLGGWLALAQRIGIGEGPARELLDREMLAVENAPGLDGPFPLLLYAPSFSSSPAENAVLAEYLASHGFIVASVPCAGTHGREMTRDWRGAQTEVRDIEFLLGRMASLPAADMERVGAIGFSWGGLAVSLLAARNTLVDAVACLDGGVRRGFGGNEWDGFEYYQPSRVRAPFLQALSGSASDDGDWEFFREIRYADTMLLEFLAIEHADFASASTLLREARLEELARVPLVDPFDTENPGFVPRRAVEEDAVLASYELLCRYLEAFFAAHLKDDEKAVEFLARKPSRNGASRRVLRVERRGGLEPPPTEREFLELLGRDGTEAAQALFRRLREADPELRLFTEQQLNRLGYRLLALGRSVDAIRVFEMNVEAYPDSWNAQDSLGEALVRVGERARGFECYRRSLELNPENDNARRILDGGKLPELPER